MSERHGETMRKILEAVDGHATAFTAFKEAQDARFDKISGRLTALETAGYENRDRLEELEARAKSPGKTGGPLAPWRKWNEFATASGIVFEVPHDVKMADIPALRPEKAPRIPLSRWLSAAVLGTKSHDVEAQEYARELQAKQVTTGTSGLVIPTEYLSQWLDMIRAASTLVSAGAVTVTMLGKTQSQTQVTADPVPSWHTEAAEDITSSPPTFALRSLTAKTLAVRVTASVEASQDSPDFAQQLSNVMTAAMATELDRAGLIGGETSPALPEPHGILGTSGVGTVAAGGALASYDKILDMYLTLMQANVPVSEIGPALILGPSALIGLQKLKTGIASDLTTLVPPPLAQRLTMLPTTAVEVGSPITSTAFLGRWRDVRLGMRREANIEILKTTAYASSLTLEFIGYLRADWLVTRPASLCTLTGITT
jgi:HK97 family phage major capsid protein